VLDHVALGALAEQPARKDAIPFIVALVLNGQLDERAGLGRIFPRRGLFACAQAHDRTADTGTLAGLHFELADEAVALVEQAQHSDALVHRGRPLDPADFPGDVFGLGELRARLPRPLAIIAAVARAERRRREQRHQQGTGKIAAHEAQSAPGRHAS
jgi:hypothetical protein